jgi:ABC-type phosphate transport system auxiliary subunit
MSDGPFIDELKTAGVFGGAFGGAFYALRWLLDWIAKRLDKRQAQLDAQEAALDMSWRDYRLQLERRIATIERQNTAFRLGFQHVSAALIRIDPQNPALSLAEKIMAQAFPDDFSIGAAMAGSAIDRLHGEE